MVDADTQQPVLSQLLPPWPTSPHQHDWTTFVPPAPTVVFAAQIPALGALFAAGTDLVGSGEGWQWFIGYASTAHAYI